MAPSGPPQWLQPAAWHNNTGRFDTIVKIDDAWSMRYPGGKGACYQHLINLMPRHRTYIESHLGGGAVMRHKRPAERNIGIERDARVLDRWMVRREHHVELVHDDAVAVLRSFAYTGHELVYCDPPYLASTRRGGAMYRYEYSDHDHLALLEVLTALPCKVMISGYANAMYDTKLAGWRTHSFMAKSHTGLREEMVWMNFPEPAALHDTRFLGSSFSERQSIQRRTQTLHRRLTELASIERTALIRWMAERFGDEFQEALCK